MQLTGNLGLLTVPAAVVVLRHPALGGCRTTPSGLTRTTRPATTEAGATTAPPGRRPALLARLLGARGTARS